CISPNRAKIDVNVNANPVAEITGPDGPACPNAELTYNGPADMDAYEWTVSGDASISGSNTGSSVTVIAAADCEGSFTVSLKITKSGCTDETSKTVTIEDKTAPVIASTTDISVNTNSGSCTALVTVTTPSVSDNCATVSATGTRSDGLALNDPFPKGETTITWNATDACQNSATPVIQKVTVIDNIAPTVTAAADVTTTTSVDDTGDCDVAVVIPNATFGDNCTGSTLAWAMTGAVTNSGSGQVGTYTFPIGTTTITYTVTDAANNTATDVMTVTVTDDENPTITGIPDNIMIDSETGVCSAIALWELPEPSDNCGIQSFSSNWFSGDRFPRGTTTVTYTAVDYSGNSHSASFTVTVQDKEKPTITGMPENIVVNNLDDYCSAIVTWALPVANDNCGVKTLTSTLYPGDPFPVGITTVVYTAEDFDGNVQTASFSVEVKDNQQPIISGIPGNITISNEPGTCTGRPTWNNLTANDNCGVKSLTSTHYPNDLFSVGTTTVVYTAEDFYGNIQTASFTVTVTDDENPVLTLPTVAASYTADQDGCLAALSFTATAADNCGVQSIVYSVGQNQISFPYNFPVGTTTVNVLVTDIHGNTDSDSFDVVVEDNTNP
ncbi:protein containing HYR domain, partial [Bacteroidales bacterium 6E]